MWSFSLYSYSDGRTRIKKASLPRGQREARAPLASVMPTLQAHAVGGGIKVHLGVLFFSRAPSLLFQRESPKLRCVPAEISRYPEGFFAVCNSCAGNNCEFQGCRGSSGTLVCPLVRRTEAKLCLSPLGDLERTK